MNNCPSCGKEVKAFHDVDPTGEYHQECAPLEPLKTLNPITGTVVRAKPPTNLLSAKQEAAVLSYAHGLYLTKKTITPQAINEMWPKSGLQAKLAGEKPALNLIEDYLRTEEYANGMASRGVNVQGDGLTLEQLAFLQALTDTGGSLEAKLKRAGIKRSVWRAWLSQEAFASRYRELSSETLRNAIPAARVALATKAGNGDLASIKYLNELTGEYRPGQEQAVDAQKMVQVVLNAIMNNVSDPLVLSAIQKDIQFQASAMDATAMIGG